MITKATRKKTLPSWNPASLGFGLNSTDHIFMVNSNGQKGWSKPEICPLKPIPVHPFNSSLHYAVQCFEGMKAYKNLEGKIRLFRPECNLQRFKDSSKRIALPDFDGNELLKCIEEFVRI
jgi:branched-chain amino acid aminotransferase